MHFFVPACPSSPMPTMCENKVPVSFLTTEKMSVFTASLDPSILESPCFPCGAVSPWLTLPKSTVSQGSPGKVTWTPVALSLCLHMQRCWRGGRAPGRSHSMLSIYSPCTRGDRRANYHQRQVAGQCHHQGGPWTSCVFISWPDFPILPFVWSLYCVTKTLKYQGAVTH